MGDLGLAVVFCVLQVTLLAAFVALCYLCCRRSRPGFRSSIASTGVFLVLALSLLCLSPYPNWVEVVERGSLETLEPRGRSPVSRSIKEVRSNDFQAKARAEHGDPQPPAGAFGEPNSISTAERRNNFSESAIDVEVDAGSRGVNASDVEEHTPTPRRFSLFLDELQRGSGWIVEFRNWVVTKFRSVVKWGWLAGVLLLAGIGWNLLRLVVGCWQLRRFRERSTLIQSAELAESLDIVQAALCLRTEVELRQTSEMTSPATIGWWRPVVILPLDWEEWNEEERLGVLAHELAHVRRHDFLTGLFSQLVLALHFYHPLINWLVNRLHLEQELAADAAAVRVLGGQKPYLKMLAGMALKDHTSGIPLTARTFLPQSGTLMARVELLRGHKVEPGDGSFSWRTAVRGGLVCLGLVVAGLRPLAGSDGTKSGDASLTSAFVPETASACLVWRPERIPKAHPISSLLFDPAKGWPRQLRNGLDQISLFWLEAEEGAEAESRSPAPDGVVLNFDSAQSRDAVLDHLAQHPERNLCLNLLGGSSSRPGIQCTAGERGLLVCRDKKVLLVSVLSASTKPTAGWNASWGRVCQADVVVGFRPSLASRFRVAVARNSGVLEEVMNQLSVWGAEGELGLASLDLNRNRCDLEMTPRSGGTPGALLAAVENLRDSWSGRVQEPLLPSDGEQETFDPVHGNRWCRLLLENSRVEDLPERLRIEVPLSPLLGIGLCMGLGSDETQTFDRIWSDHQTTRLKLACSLLRSALLAYRLEHQRFPAAALGGDSNSPPYSWRVALLPYLGRQDLFDQYRFDLPWDSPENLQLLSQIPDVYRSFGSFSGNTPYLHGTALESSGASRLLTKWTEGESILVWGVTEAAIPWTSPLDGLLGQVPEGVGTGTPVGVVSVLPTGDVAQHVWATEADATALGASVP